MSVVSRQVDEADGFALSRVLSRVRTPDAKRAETKRPEIAATAEEAREIPEFDEPEVEGDRWPLPGFAPMTRISTSFGEVHAVALRKGDLVRTARGEFKPIVWLDRVILDGRFLEGLPDANPIKITADAFGRGLPKVDVMLSPRQVIGLNARLGIDAGTEAARLMDRPGVFRQPETGLSYTMFHLGEPADVICEGLAVHIQP